MPLCSLDARNQSNGRSNGDPEQCESGSQCCSFRYQLIIRFSSRDVGLTDGNVEHVDDCAAKAYRDLFERQKNSCQFFTLSYKRSRYDRTLSTIRFVAVKPHTSNVTEHGTYMIHVTCSLTFFFGYCARVKLAWLHNYSPRHTFQCISLNAEK